MGYDVTRFPEVVDEELICPICYGVLEEPLYAPQCEHAYCKNCINQWLMVQASCPVDQQPLTFDQLKPVPRVLRNILSRLSIICNHAIFGCTTVIQLERLQKHLEECEHNPQKPVHCQLGCGLVIPKHQLKDHNCIRDVRVILEKQESRINEIQGTINDIKRNIDCIIKTFMEEGSYIAKLPNLNVLTIADSSKQDNIISSSNSMESNDVNSTMNFVNDVEEGTD